MAFFRKAADIFALDIGSSSVKALQLREAGGSHRLTALGMASLPPEAIADGSIKDAPTVIEAIRSAVSKAGIKAKETAIAISGRELIIKKVQIPEVPPRDVHPVVQLEAEHHIPFAIDEVFLDYHTVGQHGGVMDLILVAVKKSKVLEYASVVSEAGFTPSIVDVDGFALANQFELNFPEERGEAVALIDIGASTMKTNVVRAGATIFARDIPFGGNNYTQAIAQQLKIPFEQAEAAKLGRDVGVRWAAVVPPLGAGSARAGRQGQVIRINLAPEAKRRRGVSLPTFALPSLNLGTLFAAVYMVAIAGTMAYWWALSLEERNLTRAIAEGQRELAQLKVRIGQVNQIKAQAEELRKRLAVLEEIMKGQGRPIALVDTFASVIPKDLWITGFETREDFRLKVSGSAFSTTAVSDFMQNLRSSGKFQEVDIVISRRDLSKPAGLVTFEVTCRFQG